MIAHDIISISVKNWDIVIQISIWLVLIAFLPALLLAFRIRSRNRLHPVKLDIKLGGIGKVELTPNYKDIQTAHQIWTELVTRKAALPIDPEHDVIVEVYDSWYALFQRIRSLVADIPAEMIRHSESTQKVVRIATDTLNLGLRPHLTKWQARFRNWYGAQAESLKTRSPQEVQREFPGFDALIDDMRRVNADLIDYAKELKKITEAH